MLDMINVQASSAPTPALRGYLHLAAALAAPYALLLLIFVAESPRGVVGGAIFGASLIVLYWTSAIYHIPPWGQRTREWMQRLDHSMIFVFIAGAYTPFAIKLMSDPWGIPVLSVVGGLALIGIVVALTGLEAPRWVRVALYLGLGWVGMVAISELVVGLPWRALALLVLSGVLFSLGGVAYATRRPNPFPRVFGYHEIFHTLQVAATGVMYLVVALYVLRP